MLDGLLVLALRHFGNGDLKRHTQRIEDVEVLRRSKYQPRSLAQDRDVQAFEGFWEASFILSYPAKERDAGQLKQRRKYLFAKYCTQRTENLSSNKARADQTIAHIGMDRVKQKNTSAWSLTRRSWPKGHPKGTKLG